MANFTVPERLEDGPVALRPMRAEDAAPYAAAFRDDPDLGRLLGVESDPDEAEARSWIDRQASDGAERRSVHFAIADATVDTFLGEVIVHSLDQRHRRAEIGFWVVPGWRGGGIGSRAIALTISWLFDELDLQRIEITTTPDNTGVPALAERLGFTREGLLRSRNLERGQRVDLVWFGLLREEWPPR